MGFTKKWPSIETDVVCIRVPRKTKSFWRKKWQKEIDDHMEEKTKFKTK